MQTIQGVLEFLSHLPPWLRWAWIAWFAGGLALLGATANFASVKPVVGQISSPGADEVVGRSIQVRGTVANLPRSSSLWLAVRVGDLLFPKKPPLKPVAGKWSAIVTEAGNPPDGRFFIVLLAADKELTQEFARWFKQASYPGMKRDALKGVQYLDEVPVMLR